MAVASGLVFLALIGVAVGGPIAILLCGNRAVRGSLIVLFVAATMALPLSAASEPADFRGTALIMTVLLFVFGLIAINVAGALKAPRRAR